MTGQIIKRGDKVYLVRVFLGRDAITQKRLYESKTIHGTKKEAESALRDMVREFEQNTLVHQSKQTLNEFMVGWLRTKGGQVRARTLQDYTAIWTRYLKDGTKGLGRYPLSKITAAKVQEFYDAMLGRGLSPLTVRRLHTVLNQALAHAVRQRVLSRNPVADVLLPSLQRKRVAKSFEVDQAHIFLQACAQHRLGAAFSLAIETGLRPQEYTALQWPDIDVKKHLAQVNKTLFWPKGGGWVLEDKTKTEDSQRVVALSPEVVDDLRRHRKTQLEERLFLGPAWRGAGHDFVFTNSYGGPLSQVVLDRAYKAILKAAGLPHMRVYDLRHSHATMMLEGGISPKVASDRLGHSTIVLTMDTYSHVLPTMQREAARMVSSILRPKPEDEDRSSKSS